MAVLDSAQRANHISGAVAEIGVHHGKLFIGLRLLQRSDEAAVAVDVFGDQALNVDNSGKGDLAVFRNNVQRWSSLKDVNVHQGDSTQLSAEKLRELARSQIRLLSVDGGHTESIVNSDMNLAEASIGPGGIVIADDIFNEGWPGVVSGTMKYFAEGGQLIPFAVGFNKVFLSWPVDAEPYRSILEQHFEGRYLVSSKISHFAGHEVVVLSRVARNGRRLIGRNKTAKKVYGAIQNWRNRRGTKSR